MKMDDDPYTEAQNAEMLRSQITEYARNAVNHGLNRDWANQRLNRLGAPLITGNAKYQINVPIDGSYGSTVTASSRTEALLKFNTYVEAMLAKGEVRGKHCDGVFGVTLTGGEPVFYSGPEDVEPDENAPTLDTDALRAAISQMLKAGVTEQGWDHYYANQAAIDMGLEPLPGLVHKTVTVPVSGTAEVGVMVFEGADDEAVQAATLGWASRAKSVVVTPDEIGQAFMPRNMQGGGDMQMDIVDDDE